MKENNVKVSVICTAYNHEKYIRSALDGFVMQKTTFPFEVLINDDASTDNTAAIIREYEEKYPEIIKPIYQTENQYSKGVRIGNEILMPKAKGQYIAYCEGDDYWTDPNKLQKQVDFLDANPDYVACVHNTLRRDGRGEDLDCIYFKEGNEHDISFEDAIGSFVYHISSLVMRKEFNENFPDFYYIAVSYGFGDVPKAIWLTLNGKVRFLPEVMSVYRWMSCPDSFTAKTFTDPKRLIRNYEGEIAMREAIKRHVSEDRVRLLDQTIAKFRFEILIRQGKFAEAKKPPYDVFWKNMRKNRKTILLMNKYFPGLYPKLKIIKSGILKKFRGN
ncbi:MAG: glycosyltransferase [Clostridia bacterium]|nr:glycosyltransferase [Clostridia bacterium]